MRNGGFTIIELMVHCVLLIGFFGLVSLVFVGVHRSSSTTEGYKRDLDEMRRIVAAVEADLLETESVRRGASHWHLRTDKQCIDYSLEGAVLRRNCDGKVSALGTRVASFSLRPDGKLVLFKIELLPRSQTAGKRAIIESRYYLRNQESDE